MSEGTAADLTNAQAGDHVRLAFARAVAVTVLGKKDGGIGIGAHPAAERRGVLASRRGQGRPLYQVRVREGERLRLREPFRKASTGRAPSRSGMKAPTNCSSGATGQSGSSCTSTGYTAPIRWFALSGKGPTIGSCSDANTLGDRTSDMDPAHCPFCTMPSDRVVDGNEHAFVVFDAYPVSPGHSLIISRRHVADVFELTEREIGEMARLVQATRERIDRSHHPAGVQRRCQRRKGRRPDGDARSYPRHSPLFRRYGRSDGRRAR